MLGDWWEQGYIYSGTSDKDLPRKGQPPYKAHSSGPFSIQWNLSYTDPMGPALVRIN